MPNIRILQRSFGSGLLDAIEKSNELKTNSIGMEGWNNWKVG